MLLVNGKAQVEQLELAIVSVEEVPSSGAVLAGTSHVLPEAVQSGAFLGVSLRVVAICILYVVFEGMHPVDLVGGLERHRDHGHLGHVCGLRGRRSADVGCVIRVRHQDRSCDATSWLVGERSAQVIVAKNLFGQGHNGGKTRFRGWAGSCER